MSSDHPTDPIRLPVANDRSGAVSAEGVAEQAWPAEAYEESGSQLDVRRYVAAVVRYKWLIIALFVAGTAAGLGVSRLLKPQYGVQTTIWIEVTEPGEAGRGPIQTGQLLQSYAWIDLLRSFRVLDPVVKDLRLYLSVADPADTVVFRDFSLLERFRPGEYRLEIADGGRSLRLMTQEGIEVQRGVPGEPLGADAGFDWVPAPEALGEDRTIEFVVQNPRDVARRLALEITPSMGAGNSNFMRLELTGTDPVRIAETLNAVADSFVSVAADVKRAKLNEYAEILQEQLLVAEDNLAAAERELESFRVQTVTLPSDEATPVVPGILETRGTVFSNFFSLRIEQEELRRDRQAIENVLREAADTSLSITGLEFIDAVRGSTELTGALGNLTELRAELRTLRSEYTDEYPPVRRLIEDIEDLERRTIPVLARNLIDQLAAREAQLDQMIAAASGELEEIPPRQLEEAQLTRRARIAETLYSDLRRRYETAQLAAARTVADLSILDEAAPPRVPTNDPRPLAILAAALGSLGLGLLGAILLDRFDPRLRYPDQVTQGLHLSILAGIPHVKRSNGKADDGDTTHVIEAFRELRLRVVHAHGAAGPLLTTISSPGSGDGKSFVAANLALSFADQGHRTILIDGDLRRGAQHRLFGASRKPGLSDFLAGEASIDQVVQKTSFPALHVVGSGTRMQSAPELLGSSAMGDFMRDVRSRFAVIIVDSPPLGAGVDPYILGTLTGSMLLVLRTGYTDREFAEAKLDQIDRLPIRLLGAVLNAVPARGVYRYYSYIPGYESIEEGGETKQLPVV